MNHKLQSLWLANPIGLIPKGKVCSNCARYNARNVCAQALVVKDNRVLLIKRAHQPMAGFWALPGGFLDWGETLEQCAVRELLEETGVVGVNPKLIGVWSDPDRDEDGRQVVAVVFKLEFVSQSLFTDGEASELEWFVSEDLPAKIAFDHRRIIEEVVGK